MSANKRIQKLLVGENYVLADRPAIGGIAAANWVAGKIQIFKKNYSAYDGAGADAAYDGPIAIGRFDEERNLYLSEFIEKGTVKSVVVQDYTAPVEKRIDVDMTGYTSVAGEEVGVRLLNPNNREVIYVGRRVYTIKSTGTLTTDLDKIAEAINADKFNDATAVRSGDVLQITAKVYDPADHVSEPDLSVSAVEAWTLAATITVGVSAVSGVGTPDKVKLIESQEDWGESQGVLNFREFPVVPNTVVQSASTYNLITLEFGNSWGGTGGVGVDTIAPKTVVIAMNSSGTGAALLKSNLETWLNVKIDDQPDEA